MNQNKILNLFMKKSFSYFLFLFILKTKIILDWFTTLVKMKVPLKCSLIIFCCQIITIVGETVTKIHKRTDDLCIRSFDPFDYKIPLIDLRNGEIYFTKTLSGSCGNEISKVSIYLEKRNSEFDSKRVDFPQEMKTGYHYVMKNKFYEKNQNDPSTKDETRKTLEIYECDKEFDGCIILKNNVFHNAQDYEILRITGSCITICVELSKKEMKDFGNCSLFEDLIFDNFQNYKSCSNPNGYHQKENGTPTNFRDFFLLNNDLENFLILILVNSTVSQIILFGIFLCFINRRFSRFSSLLKNETQKYQFQKENRIDVKDLYNAPFSAPTYSERAGSATAIYSVIDKRKKIKTSFNGTKRFSGYEECLPNAFNDRDMRKKRNYLDRKESRGSAKNYSSLNFPTPHSTKSTNKVAVDVCAAATSDYAFLPPPHIFHSESPHTFIEKENDYSEIINPAVSSNEESDNISLASSFRYEKTFDKERETQTTKDVQHQENVRETQTTKDMQHQENVAQCFSSASAMAAASTSVTTADVPDEPKLNDFYSHSGQFRESEKKTNPSPLTRKRIRQLHRKWTLTPPKSNSISSNNLNY